MSHLEIERFSHQYQVRKMSNTDVPMIYNMTKENVQYYEFCGRENTIEDIYNDLEICPPGILLKDKYYVGFFDGQNLVAVMDLIDGYPDKETAYIGFFMMNVNYQGKGLGAKIISELCEYLEETGFEKVRLGYDKENPQSKHFWKKNQFQDIKEVAQEGGVIVVAERKL